MFSVLLSGPVAGGADVGIGGAGFGGGAELRGLALSTEALLLSLTPAAVPLASW